MASAESAARRTAPDENSPPPKVAAIIGCQPDEREMILLLLELLEWEVLQLDEVAQLDTPHIRLVFVDADSIEMQDVARSIFCHATPPIVAAFCDPSNLVAIHFVLALRWNQLTRPIDLEAVERIIDIAA